MHFPITAVTQLNPNRRLELDFDGYVIDARLRTSGDILAHPSKPRFFKEQDILSGKTSQLLREGHRYFSPKYEFGKPEIIFLSYNWMSFVLEVSKLGPTYLITEPLQAHHADPFLTSIVANKAIYL